jgi:hypothetical protein
MRRSTALTALLLLQALLALTCAGYVGVTLWQEWTTNRETAQPLRWVLLLLGFLPIAMVALHRRKELTRNESNDRLRTLYLLASGFCLAAAFVLSNDLIPQAPWVVWLPFIPLPLLVLALQWTQRHGKSSTKR